MSVHMFAMQNCIVDYQTDHNTIQKKILLEINTNVKFLLLRIEYIIGRGCLFG